MANKNRVSKNKKNNMITPPVNFKEKNPTKKELTTEIASPRNDSEYLIYNSKYFDIEDKTLQSQGGQLGIRLYDKVILDPHIYSVLQTRISAVVGKDWSILPASKSLKDKKIAEFVEETLYNTNFDFLRYTLLKSILYGYYCSEIIYKMENNQIVIDHFIDKHPVKFCFGENRKLRLLTKDSLIYGVEIPDRKFLLMNFGSVDNPYGRPLGQSLYWFNEFKKTGIKFWLIYVERFGQPTALGSYPPGTSDADIEQTKDVLNSIQTNSSIVLPDTFTISLLEASRGGNATYDDLCNFINREISKMVLGCVLVTESSKNGSYSLGKIHNLVRQDIIESDADLLDETLNNSLIKWICQLNFNTSIYPKIITDSTPPVNLLEKSQIDKNLNDVGVKFTREYFTKTYSLEDSDIIEQEQKEEILNGD